MAYCQQLAYLLLVHLLGCPSSLDCTVAFTASLKDPRLDTFGKTRTNRTDWTYTSRRNRIARHYARTHTCSGHPPLPCVPVHHTPSTTSALTCARTSSASTLAFTCVTGRVPDAPPSSHEHTHTPAHTPANPLLAFVRAQVPSPGHSGLHTRYLSSASFVAEHIGRRRAIAFIGERGYAPGGQLSCW